MNLSQAARRGQVESNQISRRVARRVAVDQRARRRRMFFESLENRSLLATITAGAGPGGFESFSTASSLALWLDASDIDGNGAPDALANGSAITTWADKSGFARNLTNTGTVSYTLASAAGNNQPATAFSNSRLQSAFDFDALSANYSIFGVSRYTGGDDERVISSVNHNWLFGHWGGGDQRWYAEGWIQQTGTNSTAFNIYTGIIGPAVPNADFWKNGTQLNNDSGGYNPGNYKPGRIELGSYGNGGETSNAEVSELLIINRNINEAERLSILNALSAKYNLAIGGQDAYLGDDPGNGDFDRNVIGIGRLDATNQLLSAGQAGFGIEATAIADNGDFVGAGHKVAINSFTAAGVPAGVSRRFLRTWAVQVNDTNDNLGATMAFDYSDAGLAIGSASTFKLLRSLDGGVSWVDAGVSSIVAGDQIKFNLSNVQLSSALYTLGDAAGPVLTTTAGNQTYAIGGAAVAIDPTLTLVAGGSPTVTGGTVSIGGFIAGNSDVLAFATIGPISGVYNSATGVLTLLGTDTVANYQAALRTVTFSKPTYQATPSRTVTFQVTDAGALSGSNTRGITINATVTSDPIVWDGTGDGSNWTDNSNWVGNIAPDSNDVAIFSNLDPGNIDVPSNVIVGSISFTSTGAYTINSAGGNLSLTIGAVTQSGSTNNIINAGLAIFSPGTALTFDVVGAGILTVNGTLAGTGNVNKNNTGVLIVGGTNTYTGTTNVNGGTLRISGSSIVPSAPAGATGIYTFDAGSGANTGSSGATNDGNLLNGANVVGGGLIGDRLNTPYGSQVQLAGGGIALGGNWTASAWWQNLHGTGDWRTLFRSNGGDNDHEVIVQAGTDNLGMYSGASGFRDSGFDLFPAVDNVWHHIAAVGNVALNTTTFYVDNVVVGVSDRASAGNIFWIGALNTNQTFANYLDEIYIYTSALSAAQITDLYKNGLGIPVVTSANSIPDASSVTVAGGAFLDLNGISEIMGALAGAGTVTSGVAGSATLTVGGGNGSATFSGVIQNGAGTVALTKIGTGTQTLSGVNTFTGATNIQNGTLQLAAGADRLPIGTVLTIGAGATGGILDLNGQNQTLAGLASSGGGTNRVVNSGGGVPNLTLNVTAGTATFGGILGNAGQNSFNLVKNGAGTEVLSGTNTFTGTTTINGGVLSINGDAALGTAPGAFVANQITIANTAVLRATSSFTLNANRGITLGAGGGMIDVPGVGVTWGGYFTGGTGVTKTGSGDLILTNNATLSVPGVTNINAGRVFFTSQNALGAGTINVNSGGTLDYLAGGALSLTNVVNIASGGNIASRPAQLTVPNATLPTTGVLIINQDDANTNTVVLPANLALTGPLTIQVGGGGGNGGIAQLSGIISGAGAITKTQNGILQLSNGGNNFSGALNVAAGTVRVTANGALGTTAGATNVSNGGTLQLEGAFNYTTAEPLNISGTGFGGAGAIQKTGGSGSLDAPITLTGHSAIGAAAGSTLTINPNVNLGFYNLAFVGAGNIVVNGNLLVTTPPANSLANLNSLASGNYSFTAASQTFNARVDNVAGTGWLLIGRGREGWEFDTDGQGLTTNVNQNLGTSAAFAPAAYSDAIVTDILAQSGLNASNVEMRLRRASNAAGSAFQEARWRNFPSAWTLAFSNPGVDTNSGGFPITYEIVSTGGAPGATTGVSAGSNTRDFEFGGNDGDRVFTWGWSGHGGQRGFSYGNAVNLVAGPSAGNFLWEAGGENHEIPYTEIYVRSLTPVVSGGNTVTQSGTGTVTLAGNNAYGGMTTVNSGILVAANNNALGTTAAGTIVFPGATLGFSGGVTVTGEAITASGTGAAGQPGAIVNIAGANTLASPVTATGAELRIGSVAGTLTISGNVNMTTAPLSFDGPGAVIVSGNIFQSAALPLNGVTSELEIWLDASDANADGSVVPNGAVVSNWQDKSGKDRDFNSVIGTPNMVTSSTHGRPAIMFDGTEALRTNLTNNNPRNFIDGNGEFTLISVARYSAADRERVISAASGHNWLFGFHGGSTNRGGFYDGWGSLDAAPVGYVTDTNWHLHANQMNVFSDANNPAGDWWRDGVRLTDDSRGTGDAFVNNVPDGLSLGAWNGLGETSTAEVSELLMFNRVLSDGELNLIQSYLATKYSLAIPVPIGTAPLVTKLGTGTVTLSGNNTYAVATNVNAGMLVAGSANALGTTGVGTTVANGATLGLTGGIALAAEPIFASGAGFGGLGAIRNLVGNNSVNSVIAMQGTGSSVPASAVTLQNPTASFSQGGFSPAQLIDGNLAVNAGGWANAGNPVGSDAVFETSVNLNPTGSPTDITFSIFSGGYGNHTIGRFKLYATTDSRTTFADSLDNGGDVTATWIALTPAQVSAVNGTTLTVNGDNSISASGLDPSTDVFTIRTTTSLANITGLRIETIKDAALPSSGPGRAGNGNYVIIEMNVSAVTYDTADITIGSDAGILTLNANVANPLPISTVTLLGAGNINFGATSGINQVSGATNVIKSGTGTVTNAGANNNFAGTLTINAGTYVVSHASALGTLAAGTTVNPGGTLGFAGNVAVGAEPVTVNAVNGNVQDSIANISGVNTFAGPITLVTLSTASSTTTGTILGGDLADGLDLVGTFPYAVNFRGPSVGPVQGVNFISSETPPAGFTFSAPNEILNYTNPNYGATANDNNLEVVMQSIRWNGGPVSFDLAGLNVGNIYKLQLLFSDAYGAPSRFFNIITEGTTILPNFTSGSTASNPVVTRVYQAADGVLNVSLTPGAGPDTNPIISGFTLEDLGPAPRQDLNIRSDAGSLTLSSGLALDGSVLTIKGAGNLTLAGNVTQGAASQVIKIGAGTTTLSGTNSYSGSTTVNGGVLQVQNGAAILNTAGPVSVALGGTFQLLTSETVSSFVGAGDIGVGTNDSTLALANNVLTTTAGASIANVTTGASGGIVAGTAIIDTDDDNNVTGVGIFLQAVSGVGTGADPIETTITNFEAATATGGVFISNTGALGIGNVTVALSGVDVTGASGAISVVATGSINVISFDEDVSGPGNITLNAQGATSNLTTSGSNSISTIRSSGAAALVSLSAGQDVILGLPNPQGYGDTISAGSILVNAGRDVLLQQDTFLDVNGSGTNTVVAGRDIILTNDASNSRLTTQGGIISLTANRNVVANILGFNLNTIDSTQGGAVPAGANVNITATTGNISFGDGISAGTAGNVILNAPLGTITDTNINGLSRIVANGLTANSATGVLLETNVNTVTSVTASGAGAIDLRELNAVNLVTVTAANGPLTLNAGGAITNAASAVIAASGAGIFTGTSIALGNQAGDSVNFGTLTFTATAGGATIEENSGMNLLGANTATGAIALTTVDLAAAGQDIVLPAGSSVASSANSVTLSAGDDATIGGNVTSFTTTTINVDVANADAGTGGAVTITGVITTPVVGSGGGAFLNGQTDNDTFTFNPQTTTEFRVNGNLPVSVAIGDVLVLSLAGTTNPNLTAPGTIAPYTGPGSGSFSFTSAHRPVLFTSIEQSTITGNYHLTYDNSITPVANLFVMRDGTQANVQLREDNNAGAVIFQGSLATILSLRVLGSAGNDMVTVDDLNTLPDFVSTVPGVTNNANVAGTGEFLFDGLGGADTLVYNITGSTASQIYGIGNGTGAAGLEGEVSSTAAGITLVNYFQNVELVQRTGGGVTPGTLSILGDASANVFATTASGAFTRTTATGYTPFEFSGNNYSGLSVSAAAGIDMLDLVGIGTGQTNPLATTLDGGTQDDTLRVQSTSGNTGVVTLIGNAGNDLFQLFSATNTVDGIFGQVVVDGTDGNVALNTDTLTIIDTGDVTADSVVIAAVSAGTSPDYGIEGINSTAATNDVIFRNIDVLNYTGTQGADTIDGRFVNTVPLHDLTTVVLNGWLGGDQFLLFTSDQAGGTGPGVTPTGISSGVATISLNGDAPGNPNGLDGNDIFGQTGPGIVGTGIGNVGLLVPDTVRGLRPSISTGIAINGGEPTGPAVPTGDTVGDVINLDISGLPANTAMVLPTVSGALVTTGFQPLSYTQIEDFNLIVNNRLTNVQMGDTFVRGTSGPDLIQFMRASTLADPNRTRVRVNQLVVDFTLTGKSVTYAGASNDYITQSNITLPAEIYGEDGDDYISGGVANDFIVGGLGNDGINGGAGDNVIWGDNSPTIPTDPTPQDLAIGGRDTLSGLGGNDVFYGGGGDDAVSAGGGNDYAYGGQGNDQLGGSDGDDRLYGGAGNDVIGGGAGNDLVSGGDGNDNLIGDTGNDVLLAGNGADNLDGGNGNDLLVSGSVANENSTFSSQANTTTFSAATYSNPADNDAALMTLLAQWGAASNRASILAITHDAANDNLSGGTGDDDFCWETIDILDETPGLTPADYNAFGMGSDERFGPT